jgi:hypothetical protein
MRSFGGYCCHCCRKAGSMYATCNTSYGEVPTSWKFAWRRWIFSDLKMRIYAHCTREITNIECNAKLKFSSKDWLGTSVRSISFRGENSFSHPLVRPSGISSQYLTPTSNNTYTSSSKAPTKSFVGIDNWGECCHENRADHLEFYFDGGQTTFAVRSLLVINKSIA